MKSKASGVARNTRCARPFPVLATIIGFILLWTTPASASFSNGYALRRQITIPFGQVTGGPLANFPVLVCFNATLGTGAVCPTVADLKTGTGGAVQNSNFYDIIFTSDAAGTTLLNWEIETFTATTGAVYFWVKIPTLSSAADNVFYMFYGKSSVTTFQGGATGAAWDGNFKGVWHLKEATGATSADSTANANNAGPLNSPTQTAADIDGGLTFNGSTMEDNVSSTFGLGTANVTMEAWANLNSVSLHGAFLKIGGTSPNQGYALGVGGVGSNGFYFDNPGNTFALLYEGVRWIGTPNNFGTGWHHVVAVINGSGFPTAYLDGVSVYSDALGAPAVPVCGPPSNCTHIGGYTGSGGENRHFNGIVDEVRVSATARTAGWIKTEYNNLSAPSTFISAGGSSTAVKLIAFTATPSAGGNLIKLQTAREVNNLGFNLYREQNGQRAKLNSSLLAGSALMGGAGTTFTAGHTRTWQDDLPGGSGSVAYWVEEIDLSGARTWYGPASPDAAPPSTSAGVRTAAMRAAVTRDALRGGVPSSAPAVSLSSIGNSATTSTAAVTVAAAATATPQNLQTQWVLAAGQALRLGVSSEGWYRVTQPQLVAAGLNPNIDPRRLQLYVSGVQQPILVEGQSDGKFESADAIDFYGLGVDTIWSGTQEYWLVVGNGTGLRIGTEAKSNGSAGASSFPFSVQWKPRTLYFAALLNGDGNNFFGPVLDSTDPLSQTLTVTHLNIATGGASPLQLTLQGATAGAHAVTVSLNGNFVGNMAFSDQNSSTSSFLVPNSYLQEGANTLGMTITGGATDVSVVDTVLLTYPHSYIADGNSLRMTAAAGKKVTVSGFSGSSIQVIDITNPSSVSLVPSTVSASTVAFVPQGGGTRTLLALGSSQFASPASITVNQGSSWHSAQAGADMVIISHASLLAAVAPLASLRQSQSHTVKVIDVQDLYDEFNFGVESPYAIQSFLSTAKANWSTKPAYVLLMGNGTFDPRNYLGTTVPDPAPDLVPVKLVDTNLLETASDDWFADFNNDGIPEIAIGRIPAETVSDATNAVNRLIAYDQSGGGGWKNQALLVAGVDQDPTDNFEGFTASVKALLPASVTATQILAGSDPLAHSDLIADLNLGQSLVNYVGHGSNEIWADGLFSSTDASGLTNGSMTPLVLSMTCLNGYFQDLYTNPLGKALLNASNGGAVAVWASSGLTDASPQSNLNQAMVSALYGIPGTTIGQAARTAKSATTDINVRRTWILLGDPAMKLQ